MNHLEQKTLLSVAQQLSALAQGADASEGGGMKAVGTAPKAPESEVERELMTTSRALDSLGLVIDALWTRARPMTMPPPPSAADNSAVPGCGSEVGQRLQHNAMRVMQAAESVRLLTDLLAI